jgi:hypothetical protein
MQVTVTRKQTLASLLTNTDGLNVALLDGYERGKHGQKLPPYGSEQALIKARAGRGFKPVVADMLTAPKHNDKLEAASVPSYGLTLAHEQIHEKYNLCPWAGDCTKVCVLNNGNGRYDSVRRAWLWRTDFLADAPLFAVQRIGWELGRAVRNHGEILFRPDVNSDLGWHRFLPSLGILPGVTTYGYTKNPLQLHRHDARISSGFHYAYSHNESSDRGDEHRHLMGGGKIAVVTSRRKGQPVSADALREFFGVDDSVAVVDADVTDEWMLPEGGIIGDLSAKGYARRLIGVSDFVVRVS